MVEPEHKLTLLEVSQELGRSLEQVRRYVREGKLPAQKLGMQWFVTRRDLDAFRFIGSRVASADALEKAKRIREKIENRVGIMNVAELLEDSRRSHP